MPTLAEARRRVRDVATKQLAIAEDPNLDERTKLARLKRCEPELTAAQEALKSAEAVAGRRAEVFGGTAPDSRRAGEWDGTSTALGGAAPPLLLPAHALKSLHEAATQRRSLPLNLDSPDELLTGNGTTGHMTGLLSVPGTLTRTAVAGDNAADTIEQAMTDLRTGASYTDADAVVFHPADWSAVRRLKDSQGRYIVDADPPTAGAQSLWGVPVKLTTMMPRGTAVVGAFALGGMLHVRRGLMVEPRYNADDFARNRTSFRAEVREALAVTRPSAFVKVTLTPPA